MKGLSNKRIIGVTAFLVIATILAFLGTRYQSEQTMEGELMLEACDEIVAYETLRAEEDIEQIIRIIKTHTELEAQDSNTLVLEVIQSLREIEEEVEFHNTQMDYYREEFASILNKLVVVELNNALMAFDSGDESAAKSHFLEAKHYLHDALFLLDRESFRKELNLFHALNQSDGENFTREGVKECLLQARNLDII